jgi:hypothetical protein
VLGLVDGWTVTAGGEGELATPTGVALVTTLATSQGPLPSLEVTGSGVGAGTRDVAGRPNVVRVVLGRRSGPQLESRSMRLLEANVDDLDPRVWPTVLAALLDAGAADAWLTPVLMKKGRPAHTLSVLATTASAPALREQVFSLTTTFGVREVHVDRWALDRGWVDVVVEGRAVSVKVAHQAGVVVHATPEFEDAASAASELGRSVREVVYAAAAAAYTRGLTRGAAVPNELRRSRARESAEG